VVPGAEEERTAPSIRLDEESVEIERMILRVLSRFPEAKQAVAEEIERMYALEDSG
jgi:hypothetical protein